MLLISTVIDTALAPLPAIVMTEHKAKLIEQWEADSAALTHRAAQEFRNNAEASKKAQEVSAPLSSAHICLGRVIEELSHTSVLVRRNYLKKI